MKLFSKVKKTALLIIALSFMLILSGCGKEEKTVAYDNERVMAKAEQLINFYGLDGSGLVSVPAFFGAEDMAGYIPDEDMLSQVFGFKSISELENLNDEQLKELNGKLEYFKYNNIDLLPTFQSSALRGGYESYKSALEYLGKISVIGENRQIKPLNDEIIVDIDLTGTNKDGEGKNRTAIAEIIFTKNLSVKGAAFNVNRSIGEKLTAAGLNTLLGMGTTFCVLITISIIIWLMGLIVQKATRPKVVRDDPAAHRRFTTRKPKHIFTKDRNQAEEEEDPWELVAVLAAAIAAYESEERGVTVSPDAFIVRSVKRSKKRK